MNEPPSSRSHRTHDARQSLLSHLTPLVGRELALREIQRQFQQPDLRLLTLVGPGGVGKTRLAIRAAAELASDFDEVVFVDFSPIADSALALSLLARTLGVLEDGEAPLAHRLATAIGNRQLLLVLDNLERILPFGSDVAMLLRSCPGTKALVTSRAPLRVSGEQEYLVPPLDLPAAIELFIARARAVRPSISATAESEPVIVAICRKLDMLPLAIELAAARAKVLSVDAILARLEHRLALLTGGPQDSPERQRSLRDAIAWSVELLDDTDRRRFRSLAVFTGGFTIDAYEYVVEGTLGTGADPLDAIFSLVDKNLVRVLDQPDGDQEIERFGLLETVREYASELLAESDDAAELRNRHAMWCVEFVELAGPMLVNGAAELWARRIDAEFPNLRSALDWLLEQERTDEALRLSSELWTYWMTFGGLGEGRQWLDNALMLPGGTPSLRVRAVGIAGHFASNQGDFAYEAQVQEALTTSRLIGDPVGEAIALYALGDLANEQNDFQRGPEYLEAAIALCDQVGDETRATMAMVNLGSLARRMGDDERAAELIGQTVERARAQQFGVALTFSLNLMSRVARARGDLRTARALYQESLETAWKLGQRVTIAFILLDGAALAAAGDQPERAARLLGAAESLRETIGMPHEPSVSHASGSGYDAVVTKIRVALGEQKFESAWDAGRSLPIEQAVEEAIWDETAQAHATRSQFGLTARELDVLRLLVAGRSDRQIGDALFISPRTAQVHVANILAKLDVPTRGAAAATALRFGVIDDAPLSQ